MYPAEIHRQLLEPGRYPQPTVAVSFRETHISRVYLTDTYAYKVKKPLNLGFLNFSTLARRRFFCHEELRLNRRFSPEIYLDVVALREDRGQLHFGRKGRLVDYAVQMRRLPEERMLSTLLDHDDPTLPAEIARLAGHLAPLLATAEPCLHEGNIETVRANILGNLTQTESAIGLTVSAEAHGKMRDRLHSELKCLAPLIDRRAAQGAVRDGHGDLHAANICMTDPVVVYDCIEFCRRFRVADVAADLAFLLMDLESRGRRDLAGIFLDCYQRKADDPDLSSLLPLYKSYRAWVRGKVNTLLGAAIDVAMQERRAALERARRYFNLALGYHAAPTLILTAGLMGVGKSSLARALAVATGAHVLRSDVVRKELAGHPTDGSGDTPFGNGLYSAPMSARTYDELRRRAAALVAAGESVIVDAAFGSAAERHKFLALAADTGLPPIFVHLHCTPDQALERLDRRQHLGGDPSDGRRDLYPRHAAAFEPFSPEMPVMEIDSSHPVDYNAQMILCQLMRF
jgi:hypothetical protein